ncbi:TetR/AcrR family transcriptional regulator [Propionispira raffinosivorans]|uniref:TetR/AcrR family transcriptional regulator n=1 Tax=Propionispira raffinosivorans TaxID=86959 RepID=UPI00036BA3EE|nr:TetR/AcrR family transcriptional regulator [Propionispira raffinosivorans]
MARTPQDPEIRINEILDVAQKCFINMGYRKTTISGVAKEMGVAKGMLYYYFKSKEELLEVLLKRHSDLFLSEIKQMIDSESIMPSEKIGRMFEIVIYGVFYQDGELLSILYDEKNLYIKEKVTSYCGNSFMNMGKKVIAEGKKKKEFFVEQEEAVLEFLILILGFLIEMFYKKLPGDMLQMRLRMTENMIENLLHSKEGSIHFNL